MDIQQQIEHKLIATFSPIHLEVVNESHGHKVPKGSQTHFRVVIVSPEFMGMTRINRHRTIYQKLSIELDGLIKALSILAFSPDEWASEGRELPESPPCLGGSRHDSSNAEHSEK